MNEKVELHQVFGDGLSILPTSYAPPQRATRAEVEEAVLAVADHTLTSALLEATDVFLLILNQERQIIAANSELMRVLGANGLECVAGSRPGEIVGCRHAWDGPAGCGTGEHCATCGAGQAIFESQTTGEIVERECLIDAEVDGKTTAYEFHVKASPVKLGDRTFIVVSFRDTSSESRRRVLERVFFHDVLNTVGGLKGWGDILARYGAEGGGVAAEKVRALADQLAREIMAQRDLLDAESGRLQVELQSVDLRTLVDDAVQVLEGHDVCRGKSLRWDRPADPRMVHTDPVHAGRVLLNMIKNAAEASREGGEVRLGVACRSDAVRFEVWNEGWIPEHVAAQIFKRSFSTKAASGRGLGTWSMKLLGEEYLGGRVDFQTGAEGTTFSFQLPVPPVRSGPDIS